MMQVTPASVSRWHTAGSSRQLSRCTTVVVLVESFGYRLLRSPHCRSVRTTLSNEPCLPRIRSWVSAQAPSSELVKFVSPASAKVSTSSSFQDSEFDTTVVLNPLPAA